MASKTKGTILTVKLNDSVILSVDSRLTEKNGGVTENHYDKIIKLYPRVFLGCLADRGVCEAVKSKFPIDNDEFAPTSVLEVANLVKDVVNFYMEDLPTAAELFLVGALVDDDDYKIYKISKEQHSWMHRVDEVVERVATGGRGGRVLNTYLENNVFTPNMTEEAGVLYAFEGIKFAVKHDWCTRGDIQVVAINTDGFRRRMWCQNNPDKCLDEYRPVDVD